LFEISGGTLNIPLKHYGRLLVRYLRPHWSTVLFLAALLVGSIGLQLFKPQILRTFIDAVGAGAEAAARDAARCCSWSSP
jgi:hypothetical protein